MARRPWLLWLLAFLVFELLWLLVWLTDRGAPARVRVVARLDTAVVPWNLQSQCASRSTIATLSAMPTEIHFASEDKPLRVDEEPSQVFDAWNAAHGLPFRLTTAAGGVDAYVNPATVTFWLAWAPPPEFPEPPPRPSSRPG